MEYIAYLHKDRHLEGMMEDGDAIPEASTLDALANDAAMNGAVAFLVNVEEQRPTRVGR